MKRQSILVFFLLIPLSLVAAYFINPANSQEVEIGDDLPPADIVREIKWFPKNPLENKGYDYDELGPYLLTQAVIVPTGTPPPRSEEDVTEEEKQSPESLQFVCKAVGSNGCRSTGTRCAQFAQSAGSALACWEEYYDCVTSVKDKCESEHPLNDLDAQEAGDSSVTG